jgi:hypothetical protein
METKYVDFMPKDDASMPMWCNNGYQKADIVCLQLGLSPAEITEYKDALQSCSDTHNNVLIKKTDLADAVKAKELLQDNQVKIIRRLIKKMKSSANYTIALGAQLGIVGSLVAFDETGLKPVLKLRLDAGQVRISFSKQNMRGICIYSRKRGELTWQKLAQVNFSPFLDTRSLNEADKPEAREYRAFFHNGYKEVGLESDVASILTNAQSGNL